MNVFGLLFLLFTQFFSGRGLLYSFDIRLKPLPVFALSMISGVMLFSFLPLLLAFAYIPITTINVTISIIITTILINIVHFRKYILPQFSAIKKSLITIPVYEYIFIIIFIALMIPSVWHCFYWPPNARDILSGPEAIAEFTVREKTMINSIFSVDLESTNNHLKPPFVTDLQIIYKLLVHPFGQTWLTVMVLSFLIFFYNALKAKVHVVLAGILVLLFISAPEVYAYSYIIMFDYCNMVLFFLGVYFLLQYYETQHYKTFLFSCLLFGFATYIRLETIILLCMMLPMLWYISYKAHNKPVRWIINTSIFIGISFILYYMWIGVFVRYYMPVKFDVTNQVTNNMLDFNPLFERFNKMNTELLFGGLNLDLFGHLFNLFVIILLTDIIIFRKYTEQKVFLLYTILILYAGLPIIGYLIPWFDLRNTTKRGLFKLVPLVILYIAHSGLFHKLSAIINNWEKGDTPLKNNQTKAVVTPNKKHKKQHGK